MVESLFQVCYDLSSEKTMKREIDSLLECAGELNCKNLKIITMAENRTIDKGSYQIEVISVDRFCNESL